MKNLGKFELAAAKKVASVVKQLNKKVERLQAKKDALDAEIADTQKMIDMYEEPIKKLSGGFTSTEILATIAETVSGEGIQGDDSVDESPVEEVEVPAEKAVEIDPTVQSPIAGDNPFGGIAPGISH